MNRGGSARSVETVILAALVDIPTVHPPGTDLFCDVLQMMPVDPHDETASAG